MAFELNDVVPWGRTLEEYREMFLLSDEDMLKSIAGFGDGPASFNCQAATNGYHVTSFDPIYQFSKEQLEHRIDEVRTIVMKQMAENTDNYVWSKISSLAELESVRMSAMKVLLEDYERGKTEKRYIYHELPNRLSLPDNSFDIGLSSHFLLLYTALGLDFHISAITEMLRVFSMLRISILSLFLTILQYFCTEKASNQMYISDWLRRTFSAVCQYLFAKIYSNFTNKQPHDLFKSCGCS